MHKFMVKFFDFMKNFIQGINVLVLLAIMLIVLNWIEALIKAQWGWMDSFRPLLDEITGLGALLMGGTFASFNVNFELKYFAAVILCVALYYPFLLLFKKSINRHCRVAIRKR